MNRQLSEFCYNVLFAIYVILDVFTTVQFYTRVDLIELNPIVDYIFITCGIGIGFLVFWFVKHLSLEVIVYIINRQNNYYNYSGYVTYVLILVMSIYVVVNNIIIIYV